MKLIWHIIKKDIRRDRVALLLWVALFAAQVGIGVALLSDTGEDREWIEKVKIINGALVVGQVLLGYVLVARLVHADLLLGTDMFWLTRPISRGRLLLAKAGGVVLLFALVPVALLVPWWAWCGCTARDMFWMGVNTFGLQLLMITPAFLIAALTDEFGRVLLWTVLLFVAGLLLAGLLARMFIVGPDVPYPVEAQVSDGFSRVILAAGLAVLLAAAVVTHQYLTRRLARSVGLVVAALVVVVSAGLFAPVNWSSDLANLPRQPSEPVPAGLLDAIKIEPGAGLPDPQRRRSVVEQALVTEVYVQGMPAELSITAGVSRQTWSWADGQQVARFGYIGSGRLQSERLVRRTYPLTEPAKDPETEAWAKLKAEERSALRAKQGIPATVANRSRILPAWRPGERNMIHAQVPEALIKRAQAEPPAYEAALRCVVSRPVLFAELPLQEGAEGGMESMRVRVMDASPSRVKYGKDDKEEREDVALSLRLTSPTVHVNGLWFVTAVVRDERNVMSGELWTVNRTTGEIRRNGGYTLQPTRSVSVGGVTLGWTQSRVSAGWIIRNGSFVPRDPQWVEHTALVLVQQEIVTRFNTRVSSERLEFRPSMWVGMSEPDAD